MYNWMNLVINLGDIIEQYCRYDRGQAQMRMGRVKVLARTRRPPLGRFLPHPLSDSPVCSHVENRRLLEHNHPRHRLCGQLR